MTPEGAIEIWFYFKGGKKKGLQVVEHFSPSHLIELECGGLRWKSMLQYTLH